MATKWRTLVAVNVEAEKVEPELTKTYEEYQKSAKVEGFRKGKIPLALVKKMFVAWLVATTLTPGITAPEASLTRPSSRAVCAMPTPARVAANKQASSAKLSNLLIVLGPNCIVGSPVMRVFIKLS